MRVHFLGIGGSGASASAAIAEAQGFEVTGCDLEPHNEFTTVFKPNQLFIGHSPNHLFRHCEEGVFDRRGNLPPSRNEKIPTVASLRSCELNVASLPRNDKAINILAVTPAIYSLDQNNPELRAAKEKGIPTMTWQQFLGKYLTKDKFVIAVCGTHGKTTTTAMIAKLLEDAGLDPTVELGAIVPGWNANYRLSNQTTHGRGYFVLEADEFNDNFLHLKPDITVVTNIEMDHPEYFKDFQAVKESFYKFLRQTKNALVANLLDPAVSELIKHLMKSYTSLQTGNSARKFHDRKKYVQYFDYSKNRLNFPLKVPGEFNKLNAKAAMQVGFLLDIDPQIIQKSLSSYTGVGRRFEYIGDYNNAQVYSDFGHHPTEIRVTAEAVREKFPNQRILLVYQPHMFSRTQALFDDFVKVFQNLPIDKVFIMDIYPSREIDTGLTSSKELVKSINNPSVLYIGSSSQVLEKIKPEIKPGDIIFFMSAGDTDKLAKELVAGM